MGPKIKQCQRYHYYIDKNFQTEFILNFCGLVAFGSVLIAVSIYWLARHSTTVGIVQGHLAVHTTEQYLLPLLLKTVLIELVIVSLATVVLTLFISHKIAGPLYRLKALLGQLGEGDLSSTMRLREDDQLKQVAEAYNEAVEKINGKIKKAKNASSLDEVKNTLNDFKT